MELLIVIAIILILMLMAIPTIAASRTGQRDFGDQLRSGDEKAQMQYESTYPVNGYACSLTALCGDPKSGAPTPADAQLMQSDLASASSRLIFAISNCTKVNLNGTDRITVSDYGGSQTVGKTGNRGFCATSSAPSSRSGRHHCTSRCQ